ncbi:unnamed protein product [Arctogadus glacialis]
METVKEVDQDGAEESEENGLAEEDVSYMVGLLQDMSDEYSMKEQDPCDLYDSSDWDEAENQERRAGPPLSPVCRHQAPGGPHPGLAP